MRKRTFGRTGWSVTEIGLGAWALGGKGYGPVERDEAIAAIEAYLAGGGNFIDTARAYGDSEQILGEVLSTPEMRAGVYLCTKTVHTESISQIPQIRRDVETSLELLGTDYLDLLYMHRPPDSPDVMSRMLDQFDLLKAEGKIRATGASIKGPAVTDHTVALCRQYIRSGRVDAIQLVYSILRQKTADVFAEAKAAGVALVARTVMESGLLTGKYAPGHTFPEHDHRARWNGEPLEAMLRTAGEIEQKAVRPPYENLPEVAMAFALARPEVSCIIPGGKTPEQVRANFAVEDRPPLDEALVSQLREEYGQGGEQYNPA